MVETEAIDYRSTAAIARWKLRCDLAFTAQRKHRKWVQRWQGILRGAMLGRDPKELTIKVDALRDLYRQKKSPTRLEDERVRYRDLIAMHNERPLRICCEGSQVAAYATFCALSSEHLQNLHIVADHQSGKLQTRSLDIDGPAPFDFVVNTLAPTAMEASSSFSNKYRLVRILHKEEQRMFEKGPLEPTRAAKENDLRQVRRRIPLHVMRHSSGHASVIGEKNHLILWDTVEELIDAAIRPRREVTRFIVWEPIASWLYADKDNELRDLKRTDLHPIALFCNRQLDQPNARRSIRDQFVRLFWLRWSRYCREPELAMRHLPTPLPRGFVYQFGDHFTPRNFMDFEDHNPKRGVRFDTSLLHPQSLEIFKMIAANPGITNVKISNLCGNKKLPSGEDTIRAHIKKELMHHVLVFRKGRKGGLYLTPRGEAVWDRIRSTYPQGEYSGFPLCI